MSSCRATNANVTERWDAMMSSLRTINERKN